MPPDEPVEETLEELLSEISHTTEEHSTGSSGPTHVLRMTSTSGDWWLFGFRETKRGWALTECVAPSLDEAHPHDLMARPYAKYFRPFLQHVTATAHDPPNV